MDKIVPFLIDEARTKNLIVLYKPQTEGAVGIAILKIRGIGRKDYSFSNSFCKLGIDDIMLLLKILVLQKVYVISITISTYSSRISSYLPL